MIGINRVQGSSRGLFGSDVEVSNYMTLTIKRADYTRMLNNDWFHGDETIAQIDISPNQFAQLLTNFNVGDGVPCTIRYTQKEGFIDSEVIEPKITVLKDEADKRIDESVEQLTQVSKEMRKLVEAGKMPKGVGYEIINALDNIVWSFGEKGAQWYKDQAQKDIDKMLVQAKSEIEAYIDQKIYSTGVAAIKEGFKVPQLEEGKKETDA